ncbi:hypothetical protein MUU74_08310 [Chryseobacterium daecheongense]|uniref:hypothetical protein n=1 Tax=Chryseobacterium daecheongense TaxID=192389 RepID=UPI001FD668BC|nr:hypothetical protein [Chryseobacterium daecheongense]UOU99944.1 hypothetical protein MUU74_08310 [Chryseobacterium daecheongense]
MKNLRIPDPCSENWELMSPQDKGRFCSVCNKCVIDFTQKEPQEIQQIIEKNIDRNICGRFYNHQLNNTVNSSEKLKNRLIQYFPKGFQNTKFGWALFSVIFFVIGCAKSKESCEVTTATTGVVVVDDETLPANNDYVIGEAKIENDSVATLPNKNNVKEKTKK